MPPSRASLSLKLWELRGIRRAGKASALLIPVPEAEFLHKCRPRDRAPLGATGLPLHVTVLYPFLQASAINRQVECRLAELAASHPPFEYELRDLGRFPGVLYLATSPATRFLELTNAVHAQWPSHPPHRGAYDEIKPHVTLAFGDEPAGLAAAVEPALPISAVARELLLMVRGSHGNWVPHLQLALGQ